MAKQLNVNLAFTADTTKARAEINALRQSLNQIGSGAGFKGVGKVLTADLEKASMAAVFFYAGGKSARMHIGSIFVLMLE